MKKASPEQSDCGEYPDADCKKWCGPTFQCSFKVVTACPVSEQRENHHEEIAEVEALPYEKA